jgi:hypothetical protein
VNKKVERPRRSWKTNAIVLMVLWIVLLIGSVTILSAVVTPFLKTLQTQSLISLDWSGYGVSSNVLFPQPMVSSVRASWIVPRVTVSAFNTYSSAWVGIGGQANLDPTLIQVGSEHNSIDGKPSYNLWYEMVPEYAIKIQNVTVSSGDKIFAEITLLDENTGTWLIVIKDETTGQGFSQNFVYNSSRLTAEWILERPTVNNQISTLANFGSITFSDAKAQFAATAGAISAFPNYRIILQTRENIDLVTISDLSKDGTSFTVGNG